MLLEELVDLMASMLVVDLAQELMVLVEVVAMAQSLTQILVVHQVVAVYRVL
jgi:hypothetical protein